MSDMPVGTLGFRVGGDVTREDYTSVLRPALEEAMDTHQGLRTLYVIADLDELEPGALWEDSKLGFDLGVRHRKEWQRSAIVTDKLFAWMIPGEARVYPLADLWR